MASDTKDDMQMPYLRAIQAIPGDTASEKMKWIGKAAWAIECPEQVEQPLRPLMRVESALRQKKYEDLTISLISEDAMVVNRALKANWYFDNSNINISAEYFCENVFPYVSVNTRARIVNKLVDNLTDPVVAQVVFEYTMHQYGIYNMCPLLAACYDDFTFNIIQDFKIAVPIKTAKIMFRKNPDLIIRYFKLLKPAKPNERASFPIDMNQYAFLLPKLVKNRVHDFAELIDMYETCPLKITLSNTCAEIFLKKGLQYLIKKPHLYINILPLKKISVELLESIFLGLLPTKVSDFNTDKLFDYLQYYPQSKRYELLRTSYLKKYNTELLDEDKNVTPALLRILPDKERIEQARIKLKNESLKEINYHNIRYYERAWICYLPIDEAILRIKEKINKKALSRERFNLLCQMIYACKVNEKVKDNDALANEKDTLLAKEKDASANEDTSANEKDVLADILKYIIDRHKNEDLWIFEQIMQQLPLLYDVPHLSKERHKLLFDIIKLPYVKFGYVTQNIIEAVIHFRLINNMPIDELILMLIDTYDNRQCHIRLNLLVKYPQYERKCLVTFAKYIEEKYSATWKKQGEEEDKKNMLYILAVAMYNFNDRCEISRTKIERVTLKDYPWLLDTIRAIKQSNFSSNITKYIMKIKAPELNVESDPLKKKIADVTTGAALALLKRNPQDILDNWEEYLAECKRNHLDKIVQRFVRATRWYKDIPIRFVKRCMDDLEEKRKDTKEMLSTLTILALLLHGNTLTKLMIPFIPKELNINVNNPEASENYMLVRHLSLCMRLSSPPVSLALVYKLCEGDYLSIALMALTNLSRRCGFPKAVSFARKLSTLRVGTRKHGLRLMYEIGCLKTFTYSVKDMWKTETHHSIRQVIFEILEKIMFLTPTVEYLKLHNTLIKTMQLKDEALLWQLKLPFRLPDHCVSNYFNVWLQAIDNLKLAGLDIQIVNTHVIALLQQMTAPPVCNLISENLATQVIKRYLFDVNADLSKTARGFSISYLFPGDNVKIKEHSKVFIESISSVVTEHWNETHSKKLTFYPYNNAVHLFIEDFVVAYVNEFYFVNKSTEMQLIDDMLQLFSSVLDPTQAPTSYLLLIYAKKLQECVLSNQCFGQQLDQYMPELVKIFSSSLVEFMAKILKRFLDLTFQNHMDLKEEFKLMVMDGLIKTDNKDSCLMAVTILSLVSLQTSKSLATRYDELIKKFREIKDPAVMSVLHNYFNVTDFNIMSDYYRPNYEYYEY